MPFEFPECLPRRQVPQFHAAICLCGSQGLAVWRKVHRPHDPAMRLNRIQSLAPGGVPEANALVESARRQRLAVGRNGYAGNGEGNSAEAAAGAVAAWVPQLNG